MTSPAPPSSPSPPTPPSPGPSRSLWSLPSLPSLPARLSILSLLLSLLTACSTPLTAPPALPPTDRLAFIAAVDDPVRPHNVALAAALAAHAPSTATWTLSPLWEADSEISDFLPSPDGRQAMYREVWHYVPKTEALVVRALAAGASPRYVVMGEPELSRLAGQVWSPDGTAIAYGLQAGDVPAFSGAGGTRRWEMRAVALAAPSTTVSTAAATAPSSAPHSPPTAATTSTLAIAPDADRRLFALDGASLGSHVYTLLAWSPATARAALVETPGGGGSASSAVRIYDTTDGHLVARVAPGGDDPVIAASPDGRRVAWLSAAAGVGTIDVRTGAWRAIDPTDPAFAPFALAWSPDGRWLGWAAARPAGAGGGAAPAGGQDVVVDAVAVDGWRWTTHVRRATFVAEAADGGLGLLALAPDGTVAMLTDGVAGDRTVARLTRLERRRAVSPAARQGRDADVAGADGPGADDRPVASEQALPNGVWGVGWWR